MTMLGILEQADAGSFAVRTTPDGKLVVSPERARPSREGSQPKLSASNRAS